jgi:hypothetical protein
VLDGIEWPNSRPGRINPKKTALPIEWAAWWAPERVWTFSRKENLLPLLGQNFSLLQNVQAGSGVT